MNVHIYTEIKERMRPKGNGHTEEESGGVLYGETDIGSR